MQHEDALKVLAGLLIATAAVAAPRDDTTSALRGHFTSKVTVHPDGRADIGDIEGVTGALQDAVRTQLQAMRFVPARAAGDTAVRSDASLEGSARLAPSGDDYLLSLSDVRLMPMGLQLKRAAPPLYPVAMFKGDRDGVVELRLRIGTDGRIKNATTVQSSDPAFETAVRSSLKQWRFEPLASEAVVNLPIWFYLKRREPAAAPPVFRCNAPLEQAHVEGQSSCIDRIEVTARQIAAKVRTGRNHARQHSRCCNELRRSACQDGPTERRHFLRRAVQSGPPITE